MKVSPKFTITVYLKDGGSKIKAISAISEVCEIGLKRVSFLLWKGRNHMILCSQESEYFKELVFDSEECKRARSILEASESLDIKVEEVGGATYKYGAIAGPMPWETKRV